MRSVHFLRWGPALFVGAICLAAGVWLGNRFPLRQPVDFPANTGESADSVPGQIELPEGKRLAAGIAAELLQSRPMRRVHVVPGRVRYDDTRHVEIKAAFDGVLTKVLVKPGDQVQPGQVLAVLSSPEVGAARADVRQRQAALDLARRAYEWKRDTGVYVAELIAGIEARVPMKELESQFQDKRLGEYRGVLLAAYSRFLLADKLASQVTNAAGAGAVSSRTVSERTSERESAEENLKSGCEQSAYDVQRGGEAAQASLEDAQRRFDVARQHLTTLLGYDEAPAQQPARGADLSLVELRAPFAGTIEERNFGVSERLKQGDTQFILADVSRLWVEADLREADWPALSLQPGQSLIVETPALPGVKLTAEVYYVGRQVSPDSNAIPVLATIENRDGLLRPGLFARVQIPIEVESQIPAVPSSAVVEHERAKFVFVEEAPGRYRRADVRTGREEGGWTEIRSGLAPFDRVVVQGAFALKSELLLEREE